MTNVSVTLEQLVSETGWLRRLAVSLVKDPGDADDLVHDTVLVAAARAPGDGRPLRPWLARVLLNRVRMLGRGTARRRRREQSVAELATTPATPDAIVGRIELQQMLAGLVIELAPPMRDVVLLHYFEGLSSTSIGNRLGLAAGTVRWRLKQAIDELRDRLEHRAPQRAWVAPLAAFGGATRGTSTAAGSVGVLAPLVAAMLAILVFIVVNLLVWPRTAPTRTAGAGAAAPSVAALTSAAGTAAGTSSASPLPPAMPSPAAAPDHERVTGVVVDGAGRTVAGAWVTFRCLYEDEIGSAPPRVRSASDGSFAYEVDRECRLAIHAATEDAESATRYGVFKGAMRLRMTGPFTLRLAPAVFVSFLVVDAVTGAPITGARLSGDNFVGQEPSATTDANGRARLRIERADRMATSLMIAIDAPGYPSVSETFRGVAAREAPIARTVRLTRGIPVSGKVIGRDGGPVAGSYVTFETDDDIECRLTDEAGRFEIAVPSAGHFLAYATPPGRSQRSLVQPQKIDIGAEGRTDVALAIVPAHVGEIIGKVVDAAGTPVAGARVRSWPSEIRPVVTAADGTFRVRLGAMSWFPRRGETVRRVFFIATLGSLSSAFTPVELRDRRENVSLTLPIGPAGLAGVVVDLEGAPVPGADVWLNVCCGGDELILGEHVEADGEGRFAFDVPRGDFVLSVRRTAEDDFDDRDDRPVTGGAHDVRLVIP